MIKQTYETPQLEVIESCMNDPLLLPASGGNTTNESLSRGYNDNFDEETTDQAWSDILWEREGFNN